MSQSPDLELIDRVMAFIEKNVAIVVLAALVLGVAVLSLFDSPPNVAGEDKVEVARAAPKTLSPKVIEQCRSLIRQGESVGLILARPKDERIDVNERLWAQMRADEKTAVMQAIACDVWQKAMPEGLDGAVVYGAYSGKRLAMLTSVGVVFE